jgi:hypothetical protein
MILFSCFRKVIGFAVAAADVSQSRGVFLVFPKQHDVNLEIVID